MIKCQHCGSSFIVKTDEGKFYCRNCRSFVNEKGEFLNKMQKADLLLDEVRYVREEGGGFGGQGCFNCLLNYRLWVCCCLCCVILLCVDFFFNIFGIFMLLG